MARGWHYAKLPLSNAPRLSFSGLCILLFLFLSLCHFCVFVFFFCSHWSLVDVPLIFFCPADHVLDWQPRILLGMVGARSVNVKKTTTTTCMYVCKVPGIHLCAIPHRDICHTLSGMVRSINTIFQNNTEQVRYLCCAVGVKRSNSRGPTAPRETVGPRTLSAFTPLQ